MPEGTLWWSRSHASVPVAVADGQAIRVFYSTRDADGLSHTASLVVAADRPTKVVDMATEPHLSPGPRGAFDDAGAMGTEALSIAGGWRLYYIGWNRGYDVPFRNALGVADGPEPGGGAFLRLFEGPILDRSRFDPCFVASASVLPDDAGTYRMWYVSCISWDSIDGQLRHRYHIKNAVSVDGIDWIRNGTVAIDFVDEREYAISTPRVIIEDGKYKAWYSYRGSGRSPWYRIGYGESHDGQVFVRKDHLVGLDPTPGAWDGRMVCYPSIVDAGGQRLMFYNGDGYGASGLGVAVLER